MVPKVKQRQFFHIVTSDKTLVSFLNTLEKSKTIHGLTKHNKRAVAAKKNINTKVDLYCMLLSCDGIADSNRINYFVMKGKSVTCIY